MTASEDDDTEQGEPMLLGMSRHSPSFRLGRMREKVDNGLAGIGLALTRRGSLRRHRVAGGSSLARDQDIAGRDIC
jgi:hypothetical protein